jgi:hypothetical protein
MFEKNFFEFERTELNVVHCVKVKTDTIQNVATNRSDHVC